MNRIYKIRRKSDGLYSAGGTSYRPYFTKNGKTWMSIQAIKIHLANMHDFRNCKLTSPRRYGRAKFHGFDMSKIQPNHAYHDCEIVSIDLNWDQIEDVNTFLSNWKVN